MFNLIHLVACFAQTIGASEFTMFAENVNDYYVTFNITDVTMSVRLSPINQPSIIAIYPYPWNNY